MNGFLASLLASVVELILEYLYSRARGEIVSELKEKDAILSDQLIAKAAVERLKNSIEILPKDTPQGVASHAEAAIDSFFDSIIKR